MSCDQLQNPIKKIIDSSSGGPVIVHSDMFGAAKLISDKLRKRSEILAQHLLILEGAAGRDRLIFPLFNYDFPSTRSFDPAVNVSQVGPLSEFIRTKYITWRSAMPVFSFGGITDSNYSKIDQIEAGKDAQGDPRVFSPFSDKSLYHTFVENEGLILFYGSDLRANTFGHYIEAKNKAIYRYEKSLQGEVVSSAGEPVNVVFKSHYRPKGQYLGYDFNKMSKDLIENGLLSSAVYNGEEVAQIVEAKKILEYQSMRMEDDPLYMLDAASRDWIEPMLDQLGRPFNLEDFEGEDIS